MNSNIRGQPQRRTVPLALEVIAMSKRFGTFVALDQVSLRVHAGSMHALLGENGAGKSTLVKCIMGYHRPDDGDLLVWAASARWPIHARHMPSGWAWCTSILPSYPT